jgi:PiT family inorganic phosphate transporter
VRWGVAREIVNAWVLTFPVVALLGAGLYYLMSLVTTGG